MTPTILDTIGYQRAPTPADLIARLEAAGVERLVDVRALPSADVELLADSLDEVPTAVMCLEHEPRACHRQVLAQEIQLRRPCVEVIDL